MFKNRKKYTILLMATVAFTACSTKPQTIIVGAEPTKLPPIKRPQTEPIKEEILIRNNPNLGHRMGGAIVDVPKNNPTLDIKVFDKDKGVTSDELNGETMERMAFPADEYNHLKKMGRSTVSGTIYLQNSINDKKILGQKIKLYLNPVTSYSRQWYEQSYLGGYKMSPPDKRLYNYLKSSYSDDGGKFDFFGVPIGNYYLIGKVSCGLECGFNSTKSIRLVKEIFVGSGVTHVELTKIVP